MYYCPMATDDHIRSSFYMNVKKNIYFILVFEPFIEVHRTDGLVWKTVLLFVLTIEVGRLKLNSLSDIINVIGIEYQDNNYKMT